jgi:hypothetical protein
MSPFALQIMLFTFRSGSLPLKAAAGVHPPAEFSRIPFAVVSAYHA